MGLASWGLVVLVSVEAGSEALEEKSIPSLIADAQQGDVESQWFLGYLYSEGVRVEEDLEESFRWTKPAAEAGHPRAQYNMAWFYKEGTANAKRLSTERALSLSLSVSVGRGGR